MMSKRFYLVIVLSVFVVVFAAATQHKAVFAGGTETNPEGSCQNKSIALIFPDNTGRAVTYARDYNRKTGADVMDVAAIFADLTAAYQRNFKSVVRAEKMEEAKALNVDLIAVIDLQYTLPDAVENDVVYEVSANIMTPAQLKIDSIRGSSVKSPAGFPGVNAAKRIGDALKVAAIEAEYRMEDALHSSVKMTAFCGPNNLSEKITSPASPPQTGANKPAVIANSSPEKTVAAESPTQTTVTSEETASPHSKKARKTRSSKRTAKVKSKSNPFSRPVNAPPSSSQTEAVIPEAAAPASAKAASKAKTGASRKAMAARSQSSEQKSAGMPRVNKVAPMNMTADRDAYAIVIGVEQYRQKLPKADFANHDAQAMTETLTKVLGYPAENVITLINDQATNADLAKYLEKWLRQNVKTGSTVFIYFSGLGTSNPETGDVFLIPYDGDPTFIDQTGYSLKRMTEALRKLPTQDIIVVLDSCFSGAGGKSILVEGAQPQAVNLQKALVLSKNMTVLAAASGNQMCLSYQDKSHSLFTYYLLNGIKNEDVILPNGSIDLEDLFSYIQPQVERISVKKNYGIQSPQLIAP